MSISRRPKQRDILDFLNTGARISQAYSSAKRNELIEKGISNSERQRNFNRQIKLKEIQEKENEKAGKENEKQWLDSIDWIMAKSDIACGNCGYISGYAKICGKCRQKIELSRDEILKIILTLESASQHLDSDPSLLRKNFINLPKLLQFYYNERQSYIEKKIETTKAAFENAKKDEIESYNEILSTASKYRSVFVDLVYTKLIYANAKNIVNNKSTEIYNKIVIWMVVLPIVISIIYVAACLLYSFISSFVGSNFEIENMVNIWTKPNFIFYGIGGFSVLTLGVITVNINREDWIKKAKVEVGENIERFMQPSFPVLIPFENDAKVALKMMVDYGGTLGIEFTSCGAVLEESNLAIYKYMVVIDEYDKFIDQIDGLTKNPPIALRAIKSSIASYWMCSFAESYFKYVESDLQLVFYDTLEKFTSDISDIQIGFGELTESVDDADE